MITYEVAVELADERLSEAGFDEMSLAELNLPNTEHAPNGSRESVPYVVFGDEDAPYTVLHDTPYLTRLDPHFKLRLAAKQVALGDEYRVIGINSYDPAALAFDKSERKIVAQGDFSPLSARILRVADFLKLNGEQVILEGYSKGADSAIQTAHDLLKNPNRGSLDLVGLSASEAARMKDRSVPAVIMAMQTSSKRLYENITASNTPSLLEAWGMNPDVGPVQAKKIIDKKVNSDVVENVRRNPASALAIVRGFATDVSARQLEVLIADKSVPLMLTRQIGSLIFPADVMEAFIKQKLDPNSVRLHVEMSDHSADDNIRISAARILYFASRLFES